MGLGDLTDTGDEESSGAGKSTHIKFQNPSADEVEESAAHRHKQEYYDAAKSVRNRLGPDINVVVGEFLVAAEEAEDGNEEPLEELFQKLAE